MTDGTVYFVQAKRGGPIKIGFTSGDPKARVRGMQTGSPERLRVIGSCGGDRLTEKDLHASLREHRLTGEWFKDCPEVRKVIHEMTGDEGQKPRVKMLKCGCVPGWHFCPDADSAWRSIGLARARGDNALFAAALKRFGEHTTPHIVGVSPDDELGRKRREREEAA